MWPIETLSEHCEKPEQLPIEDFPPAPKRLPLRPMSAFLRRGSKTMRPRSSSETCPAAMRRRTSTPPPIASSCGAQIEPSERPLAFIDLSHGLRQDGNPLAIYPVDELPHVRTQRAQHRLLSSGFRTWERSASSTG